jgi:hypothetical protein
MSNLNANRLGCWPQYCAESCVLSVVISRFSSVPRPILVIVMTGTAVTAPRTKYRMDERRSDNCRTNL